MFLYDSVTSNIDLTIDFYAALNREKLLSKYIYFHRLKYLSVKNNFDFSGGFIRFGEVKTIASLLKTSHHNIRKLIKAFVDLGWLVKKKTGYVLIGWREIAKKYGIELKRLRFFENDKKELIKTSAQKLIRRNISQQIFNRHNRLSKGRVKKMVGILSKEPEFTMSVKTIREKLGYKCDMTGTRVTKMLQSEGLLKIKSMGVEYVCHAKYFPALVDSNEEFAKKCFIAGNGVYRRLCNNLIPINKKNAVETLLKNALTLRKSMLLESDTK